MFKLSIVSAAVIVLFVSFFFARHSFAYALIDLNPGGPITVYAATSSEEEGPKKIIAGNYEQKGHLLALVPVNFKVRVVAHADGRLELDYPWFSFITLSRKNEIETELKVAIDNTRRQKALGSVRAAGEPENPEFTDEEAKEISAQIERILNKHLNQQ